MAHDREGTPYYDLSISKAGGSRILAVTQLLPKDWQHVRVTVLESEEFGVTLRLEELRYELAKSR